MTATSSRESHTNYACPVADCTETEKRVRPSVPVPALPMYCPQRACRGAGGAHEQPAKALEVAKRGSSAAQLLMQCPRCGWSVSVPRPQFDAGQVARQRLRDAADLAER
jgi:hypothetical protein